MNLLNAAASRYKKEGLNTLEYKLIKVENEPLFTRIIVDYNESKIVSKKY